MSNDLGLFIIVERVPGIGNNKLRIVIKHSYAFSCAQAAAQRLGGRVGQPLPIPLTVGWAHKKGRSFERPFTER